VADEGRTDSAPLWTPSGTRRTLAGVLRSQPTPAGQHQLRVAQANPAERECAGLSKLSGCVPDTARAVAVPERERMGETAANRLRRLDLPGTDQRRPSLSLSQVCTLQAFLALWSLLANHLAGYPACRHALASRVLRCQ